MNRTSIEWCDFTANPLKYRAADGRVVWACVKKSPGCKECYAEHLSTRYAGVRRAGDWNAATMATLTPFVDDAELRKMLTTKTISKTAVSGSRVFVGDMTDIFGEWVPDALIDRLMAVFALSPDVTWILVTKRASRAREYFSHPDRPTLVARQISELPLKRQYTWEGARSIIFGIKLDEKPPTSRWPLRNLWLLVSAERQQEADERIPELLQTPVAVRGVSLEPLLGPIELGPRNGDGSSLGSWLGRKHCGACHPEPCPPGSHGTAQGIDWLIVGGESGHGARPCDVAWVRSIVQQGQVAGVATFVKQLGANAIAKYDGEAEHPPDSYFDWLTKDRKGGDITEFPADLQVRQWPEVRRG